MCAKCGAKVKKKDKCDAIKRGGWLSAFKNVAHYGGRVKVKEIYEEKLDEGRGTRKKKLYGTERKKKIKYVNRY